MMESSQAGDLTPEERFREIAYILAMGIVRSHGRSASAPDNRAKILPESSPDGLEVPAETRLSVRVV
jgi:hypothetical protein